MQRTFSEVLLQKADLPVDVLVTISDVEVTNNLHSSTIWLYISPLERAQEVLDLLKPQMYDLQGAFNRALRMQPMPRLILKIDRGASYAQRINTQLSVITNEKSPSTSPESTGDSPNN